MAGLVAALAAAFGGNGTVEKLLRRKLEAAGTQLLLGVLTPIDASHSAIENALEAIEFLGGDSADEKLESLGRRFLSGVEPIAAGQRGANKARALASRLNRLLGQSTGRGGAVARGAMRKRRQSRSEWLANKWRRDWRSQPRRPAGTEAGGEWMEGRLDHPIGTLSPVSRKQRQRRTRAIRGYRQRMKAAGYVRQRPIFSSWGQL